MMLLLDFLNCQNLTMRNTCLLFYLESIFSWFYHMLKKSMPLQLLDRNCKEKRTYVFAHYFLPNANNIQSFISEHRSKCLNPVHMQYADGRLHTWMGLNCESNFSVKIFMLDTPVSCFLQTQTSDWKNK